MATYQVTDRQTAERYDIEAESHAAAAAAASMTVYRYKGLQMRRVSGSAGLSGMFQGYRKLDGGLTSVGPNWHVTESR